jgi:hypothetical protein
MAPTVIATAKTSKQGRLIASKKAYSAERTIPKMSSMDEVDTLRNVICNCIVFVSTSLLIVGQLISENNLRGVVLIGGFLFVVNVVTTSYHYRRVVALQSALKTSEARRKLVVRRAQVEAARSAMLIDDEDNAANIILDIERGLDDTPFDTDMKPAVALDEATADDEIADDNDVDEEGMVKREMERRRQKRREYRVAYQKDLDLRPSMETSGSRKKAKNITHKKKRTKREARVAGHGAGFLARFIRA